MFGKNKARILMFGAIRAEFKCLKGYGQNSND